MPGKQATLSHEAPVADPVCGTTVDPHNTRHRTKLAGELYYFCSERCRVQFVRDPSRYRMRKRAVPIECEAPETPLAAIHVCPTHPEVRQLGPGTCRTCGMALELETVTGATGPSPELAEMTRRFWIAVAFSFPLLVLEISTNVPGLGFHPWLSPRASGWMQLGLATPVVMLAGWPIFVRGWASVVSRSPSIFTLIALGVGGAYAFSVIATLSPRIVPEAFRRADGAITVYFEAAAAITVLVLLGQVLALRARERKRGAIRAAEAARPIRESGGGAEHHHG